MPKNVRNRPRRPDAWVSVLAAAREKGVSRHGLLAAGALGEIRIERIAGKLVVDRRALDAWEPDAQAAAA